MLRIFRYFGGILLLLIAIENFDLGVSQMLKYIEITEHHQVEVEIGKEVEKKATQFTIACYPLPADNEKKFDYLWKHSNYSHRFVASLDIPPEAC